MIPIKVTQPRVADLSRFTGKEIVQRYPRRYQTTAEFFIKGRQYYLDPEYTGQLIYVVLDDNGVCAVTDAAGKDIPFAAYRPQLARLSDLNSNA